MREGSAAKYVYFFQPTLDKVWSDQEIEALIGIRGDASWHGQPIGTGAIVSVQRTKKFGQVGLWICAELPDPPLAS